MSTIRTEGWWVRFSNSCVSMSRGWSAFFKGKGMAERKFGRNKNIKMRIPPIEKDGLVLFIRFPLYLLPRESSPLLLQRFPVELKIGLRGSFPREVRCHGIVEEWLPMLRLKIETDGLLDGVEELLGIVSSEFKAVSFLGGRIVMGDGIVQSSRGPNHGDRPIFQAINLIESTRLIFRRHEEQIRPRLDFMSEPIIISDSDPCLLRIFLSNHG